jgi:dTDP-4-amino-4,6-dideoxygalactose transaminase
VVESINSVVMFVRGDLAVFGGKPVRGRDDPLPQLFPRVFPRKALDYVREVVESGLTSDVEERFKRAFAEACGVKNVVTVANCTAAVHAAIASLNLGSRDEVVVSAISDYGSVAGVIAEGAIPVFSDVDVRNGCVTAEEVEKVMTPRTKAIIVVHWYGLMCDMDPIIDVARERGIIVIEDCCQNPLGEYKGRKAGTIGDLGCFSFDPEKHLSAGGGGAVITNSDEIARRVEKFANLRGAEFIPRYGRMHTSFGLNYRWSPLNAALALANLEFLPEENRRRVELANMLNKRLEEIDGVIPIHVPDGCSHLYWLYALQLDTSKFKADIWQISDALNAELNGLSCSPAPYYLLPESVTFLSQRYPNIKYGAHMVPNAKTHIYRVIRWCWTHKYTKRDIEDIGEAVEKVLSYYHK